MWKRAWIVGLVVVVGCVREVPSPARMQATATTTACPCVFAVTGEDGVSRCLQCVEGK